MKRDGVVLFVEAEDSAPDAGIGSDSPRTIRSRSKKARVNFVRSVSKSLIAVSHPSKQLMGPLAARASKTWNIRSNRDWICHSLRLVASRFLVSDVEKLYFVPVWKTHESVMDSCSSLRMTRSS